MCSVKTWMFETEEKGGLTYLIKIALISNLKIPSLHPLDLHFYNKTCRFSKLQVLEGYKHRLSSHNYELYMYCTCTSANV